MYWLGRHASDRAVRDVVRTLTQLGFKTGWCRCKRDFQKLTGLERRAR